MKHLAFVHHENTQCNHIYCHEKTTWYKMEASVLNLGFSNIQIFVLSITFPIIIRNTSFGKWPWWYYEPWKESSSFVVWNKIRYFTKSTKLLAFVLLCTIFIVLNISFFLATPQPHLNYKGHWHPRKCAKFLCQDKLSLENNNNLVTCSTDGAPVRLGNIHGFAALVKKGAPHLTVTHCFLSWHALAINTLPAILRGFLSTVLKVVNFIRARVLNYCLFKKCVRKMEREYKVHL